MQQDVGRGFLHVLPVGGVPQPRAGGRFAGEPEQSTHRLGDVVDEGEQPGGRFRLSPHHEVRQREAVQEDIAAHGQVGGPEGEPPQLAAVVECAAPDDLQPVGQDGFFEEVPADRVQVGLFRCVPEVEVVPAAFCQRPAKGTGQGHRPVPADFVPAEGIGGGQIPELFRKAVVPQLREGPLLPSRPRHLPRHRNAGLVPVDTDETGRVIF